MKTKCFNFFVVLLCFMFSIGAWGQALVGEEDNSSGWFAATSDKVSIPDNSVTTITFVNYGTGTENYHNWNLCLAKSDADITGDANENVSIHALLRSDLYGWIGNRNSGTNLTISNTGYGSWESFKTNMNGANVAITINRTGNNVGINAVATKGAITYTESTNVTIAAGEAVYAYLVTDNSHFTNVVATQQQDLTGTIIGNQDFTTGWHGATSDKWALADKTTTTITFVNHNGQAGDAAYKNWILGISPDKNDKNSTDPVFAMIRADHYGWINTRDLSDRSVDLALESNWDGDWEKFNTNMKNANVTITITRDGSSLDIKAVSAVPNSSVEYIESATVSINDDAAYAYLTVENAYLSNVQMTRSSNASGIIPADASSNKSNPGENTTVSWTSIGDPVTAADGTKYWKLNGNTDYVKLTGPFKAGDVLTVGVSSNGNNKTVGFYTKEYGSGTAHTTKASTAQKAEITYTLTAADIEDDGSIKLFRNGSEVRFYSFDVVKSGAYAVVAQTATYKNGVLDNANIGGTATVTPTIANAGDVVTFTAVNDSHYDWDGWYNETGTRVSTDKVYQPTVGSSDLILTARFNSKNYYTIRTAVSPAGSGTATVKFKHNSDLLDMTSESLWSGGESFRFTAASTSDKVFSHWEYGNGQRANNVTFDFQLNQENLGNPDPAEYNPVFTAVFVDQTIKSWDFRTATLDKLSDNDFLGTLSFTGTVATSGSSTDWILGNYALGARSTQNITFPVKANQIVKVTYKYRIESNGIKWTPSMNGTSLGNVSVSSWDEQTYTYNATEDGIFNINVNNGVAIAAIEITDVTFKFQTASATTTYDFSGRTEGAYPADIYPGEIEANGDVRIHNTALYNYGSGPRALTIKNVKKGDVVRINYSKNGSYPSDFTLNSGNITIGGVSAVNGTSITSGTDFVANADGDITVNVTRAASISTITVTSTGHNRNIITTSIDPLTILDKDDDITLNESNYSVSDINVAKVYKDNNTGKISIRYLKPGTVDITASVNYLGNDYTTTTTLEIYADEATYTVQGNKYTLTGEGVLANPVVTEVPKITMQFGNGHETVIVKKDKVTNPYTSSIIGTEDAQYGNATTTSELPSRRTYYVFKPEATGTVTVETYGANDNLIVLDDNKVSQTITTVEADGDKKTISFATQKGKTYYLSTSVWGTVLLNYFSFDYNFKFPHKAYIKDMDYTYTDASGVQKTAQWIEDVSSLITDAQIVDVKCFGNVTAEADDLTGKVTNIQGEGGAILVTAYNGPDRATAESDYYVITVPYANHTWDFTRWQDESNWKQIDYDGKQWGVEYEVREYKYFDLGDGTTAHWLTYLNEPILTPTSYVSGESAAYFGETAGLMFSGAGRTFGERASGDDEIKKFQDENPGVEITDAKRNELLSTMRNYTLENITKTSINMPALKSGATLTIPGLKAGSYVAIKFWRHAPNSGDNIKITNVYDLRGTQGDEVDKAVSESDRVQVVNQTGSAQVATAKYGWLEFKVKEDGNVTIQVTDQGWTHIKKIAISDQGFINTDMRLVIGTHTATTRYAFPGTPDGTFKDIVQYNGDRNYVHTENGKGVVFSIKPGSVNSPGGERAITVTPGGLLQASSFGTATIVQKVFNNGTDYLIDFEETDIVITPPVGDTHQTYPYTWDFTNISSTTQSTLIAAGDWNGDASVGFTPGSSAQNGYLQNSDLKYDFDNETGAKIPEFEGLGFATTVNAQGQTAYLNNMTLKPAADIDHVQANEGLRIGTTDETIVIVPDVPEGAKAYVRLVPGTTDKKVILTGNDLYQATPDEGSVTTPFEIVDGEELYVVDGHGGDVVITFKDVTVKGIGVTNIFKQCIFKDEVNDLVNEEWQYCYHSDSHDVDIEYPLTKFYTDIEMTAYKTAAYNEAKMNLALEQVTIVPANAGLIVRTTDYRVEHPLFVPAINTTFRSDMSGNNMIGFPHGGTADEVKTELSKVSAYEDGVFYGFTNVYGKVEEGTLMGDRVSAPMPGFYKLYITGSTSLNPNLAILSPNFASNPQSLANLRAFSFTFLDLDDSIETGVHTVSTNIEDGVYYTVTGVKLQGTPTAKGVYIQNGKKVFIK